MRGLMWWLGALGLLLTLLAAPAATLHGVAIDGGLLNHLAVQVCTDVGLVVLLSAALVSLVPVARLTVAAAEVLAARKALGSVEAMSEARRAAGVTYWAVPLDNVTFFTAGVRSPRIYASTAAERVLPPAVFEAAVLHELAHCKRGDVWRNLVLRTIDGAGGWLPGVHSALRAFRLRAEHAADTDAIAAGASRRDLFEAIVSVCGPPVPGAVAMSQGDVLPRLQYLAGTPWTAPGVTWRAPVSVVLWSVALPVAAHTVAVAAVFCTTS